MGAVILYRSRTDTAAGGTVRVALPQSTQPQQGGNTFPTGVSAGRRLQNRRVKLDQVASAGGRKEETRILEPSYYDPTRLRAFFQFKQLAPGRYLVSPQEEGFAKGFGVQVSVIEGLEAGLIDPLVLQRPANFELNVQPPRDPQGKPWQVTLKQPDSATEYKGQIMSRHWHQHGIPEGVYQLKITSYSYDWWLSETIDVRTGNPPFEIEFGKVPLRGTITLGGKPVTAILTFGDRGRAQSIRFEADDSGYFHGYLPREGEWRLAVELPETRQDAFSVTPVQVERRPGDDVAEVEIELPGTAIHGEVVDEEGAPVAGVKVKATDLQRRWASQTDTSEDGTFTFQGVSPGTLMLTTGRRGHGFAEAVYVKLEEKRSPPKVVLIMRRLLQGSGQVFSAAGPVPQAVVYVLPRMPPGAGGAISDIRHVTGPDGEFGFSLPQQAQSIDVLVMAPGFAARVFNAHLPTDRLLLIPVEPEGGMLDLGLPQSGPEVSLRRRPYLLANGAEIPLSLFNRWAEIHHGHVQLTKWELPMMEPGNYELCVSGEPTDGIKKARPFCVNGFLPSYGRVSLELAGLDTANKP